MEIHIVGTVCVVVMVQTHIQMMALVTVHHAEFAKGLGVKSGVTRMSISNCQNAQLFHCPARTTHNLCNLVGQ